MRSRRLPELGRRLLAVVAALLLVTVAALAAGTSPGAARPAQAADELPTPTPDPAEVREEADRILGGSEFGDRLEDPGVGGSQGGGGASGDPGQSELPTPDLPQPAPFTGLGAIGQVVMWIVVVALVALAGWVIARAVAARRRRPDAADEDDDVVEAEVDDSDDVLDPLLRPADEWRALAAAQEADGRWREGLRSRYRALLADLLERGAITDVAGWTTGELRLVVAASAPAAAGAFDAASELFDRAWYGAKPTGRVERDRFVEHERAVLRAKVGSEAPDPTWPASAPLAEVAP